jgi:ArsR family transcriptional regulator
MTNKQVPFSPSSRETFDQVAAVLRVLGHPQRLMLVCLLSEKSLAVGELAESLELAPNAVSQHLSQMQARGIVSRTRQGRRVYYEVANDIARNLVRCLQARTQAERS